METKFKVLIGIGSALVLGTTAYAIYKFMDNKKEDDLSLEIGTVDWASKKVPFKVLKNGKVIISETIDWTKDRLGKEFGYTKSLKDKNQVWGANLQNGMVLTATSLGNNKSGKTIDFGSKTIKDYNGQSISKDIEGANKVITNLFI
jgi:hypothetical protein